MARITVVILLLWSVSSSVAGMRNTAQVHNGTHLEKHFTRMVQEEKEAKGKEVDPKEKCLKATYKTVTLYDFVYKHNCFPEGWEEFLALKEVQKDIEEISFLLSRDAKWRQIEPPMPFMFRAFTVPRDQVKVVIIGQDPVPEAGQATGLAFSLKTGQDPRKSVPTVFNMLVELKVEGVNVDLSNGDLTQWIKEGVLLLNAALTVRQGSSRYNAGTHLRYWEVFTRHLVEYISKKGQPTAWILWGGQAKAFVQKHDLIDLKKHYVKAGGHPSPQGPTAGIRFFGRNYFKCANEFLVKMKRGAVDWSLPPRIVFGMKPDHCDAVGL